MIKLSDAEIYIMHIIWQNDGATSFDILDEVKKDKKLSLFTVRTLLARMVKKKAVYVADKSGKTYYYKALIERDDYLRKEGNNFLDTVYKGDIRRMFLNYIKEKKLTKEILQQIKSFLDDNLNQIY